MWNVNWSVASIIKALSATTSDLKRSLSQYKIAGIAANIRPVMGGMDDYIVLDKNEPCK